MKFIKLSVLAMSLGMFLVSCGSGEATDAAQDTTEPVIEEQIAPETLEPVAPVVDTTVAPVAPEEVPAP